MIHLSKLLRATALLTGMALSGLSAAQTVDLLFAGDLMQHQAQIDAARTSSAYCYDSCFARVKPEIERADLAVANLEVTFAGKPYRGYPQFSAPDEYLDAIKEAGFDVLLTANNHCLDGGSKGLERTLHMLDSADVVHAGTYRDAEERIRRYPLVCEVRKGDWMEPSAVRVAFLNYTYGTNGLKVREPQIVNYIDTVQIKQDIRRAHDRRADVIIACMHWGVEYRNLPEDSVRRLARWLIAQGVDHVIGSHPHVVQPLEVLTDETGERHLVVYSLGNYISNMSKAGTDGGLMVRLQLTKDPQGTRMSHCAYSLVWTSRPVLSGRKQYEIYPAARPPKTLTEAERQRLNRFVKESRRLFEKHNSGINEYFF